MKILGERGERKCLLPRALPRPNDPGLIAWLGSGISHVVSQDDHAARIRLGVHERKPRQWRSSLEERDATPEHNGANRNFYDVDLLRFEKTSE